MARRTALTRRVRTVRVTQYVTPLKEGGSVPAIVGADDDGMYASSFVAPRRVRARSSPR